MGATDSTLYPSVESVYESLGLINESIKKDIHTCASKLYNKLKKSHPVSKHSEMACYVLAMKQLFAYDVPDGDRNIKKALRVNGINTENLYKEELRILLLYPSLCDDIGKLHPRLAKEVDEANIITDEELGKRKSKTKKNKNKKRMSYTKKQGSAMRSALKQARAMGYKDYSPSMRKMISSAIRRAK